MKIDAKDLKVLEQLRLNSKQTVAAIAKKTLLPVTTVHNRIKKMENAGVITRYSVVLNRKLLGKPISAYVAITLLSTLPNGKRVSQEEIARKMKMLGIGYVHLVAGVWDMIVRIDAGGVEDLFNFVTRKIREIEGVDKTQTMLVLKDV